MEFLYLKALHIIFVVCWFAGLFYIVRLFIYTAEANKKEEPARSILTEQLQVMQRKLWYIITWPSAIGTTIFGFWMILENPAYLALPWMWLKLVFVGFLIIYHIQCHVIFKQQSENDYKFSSFKLRLFNELATIFLVAIVFLVVVKSTGGFVWGMLGLFAFAGLLMLGVFLYKKQREKAKLQAPENKDAGSDSNQTPPSVN